MLGGTKLHLLIYASCGATSLEWCVLPVRIAISCLPPSQEIATLLHFNHFLFVKYRLYKQQPLENNGLFNFFNVMEAHGFNTPNAVSAQVKLSFPLFSQNGETSQEWQALFVGLLRVAPTQFGRNPNSRSLGGATTILHLLIGTPPLSLTRPVHCHLEITWHSWKLPLFTRPGNWTVCYF